MIDKTPILMMEGDLIIIGPQRHGVPAMPDVEGGHLRISVPFQPANREEQKRAEKAPRHPEKEVRTDHIDDEQLDEEPEEADWWWQQSEEQTGQDGTLEQLVEMGFDRQLAQRALKLCDWDVIQAAQVLADDSYADLLQAVQDFDDDEQQHGSWEEDGEDGDADAALARRLQMQELNGEAEEDADDMDQRLQDYNHMLDVDDGSWDGYGDLMHNSMRRKHLNLDMLGAQTIFSIGAAALPEKVFFELLSLHSIHVLYDFRPTDHRDEVHSQQKHFDVRLLKGLCRTRHIHYRHVPVGKETAYGVLKHMESDEVQHILVELVWRAKHTGRTAMMGAEEDWRSDGRIALAQELVKHGHVVEHIRGDGSTEQHVSVEKMPDFLLLEEARLRKIHAARKAGEMQAPKKSAVDRSTEAIARTLAAEKFEVDVGAELKDAENQDDLVRAQKRMVRMQMAQARKEPGLSKTKLTHVPKEVLLEASKKQTQLNEKAKKAKEQASKDSHSASASSSKPTGSASSSHQHPLASADVSDVQQNEAMHQAAAAAADGVQPSVRSTVGRWNSRH
eukprot:CAMPEP_0178395010 /NCGR_PEP_ID=MMETSP0689_2-20121128/13001_1 /TAXON_ID=160604 /ORGANISM="Amphidinium massartii, Strain CS-259" /LENGTH=560 /DNA_ID=CAMNT_0020015657 /DNA_START=201 /DNA_END=1880 /DNA_ORIENTATION=+